MNCRGAAPSMKSTHGESNFLQHSEYKDENSFMLGFEPPIHELRDEHSATELFDLLMTGHKISVYQVLIFLFTNHLPVRTCHKMTYCEQFRTNCCVKIYSSNVNKYHRL